MELVIISTYSLFYQAKKLFQKITKKSPIFT